MKVLVGNTGFVGSNLCGQIKFDKVFNSKNIEDSFGLNPDILIYSGIRAEKFLANKDPQKDFDIILNAMKNIKKINPKKVILISTIDVYPTALNVDENSEIIEDQLQPYGKNRLYLEKWIENNFDDYLILRLPALFGENIKKNFIYDILNNVPSIINETLYLKYQHLSWLKLNYSLQENGFYKLNLLDVKELEILKNNFKSIEFSALNFTDSRGIFQFYNLKNLSKHIDIAISHNIKKLNLATQPLSVNEIYKAIYNKDFNNEFGISFPHYDFHTSYFNKFGDVENYIESKEKVLLEIIQFINENKN